MTELKLLDQMSKSTISINVSNPDSTKNQLRSLFGERLPSGEDFDQEIDSEIDTMLAQAKRAGLRLSSNREFGMDSYGFIVPKALPGWDFGDRLLGEWDLKKDTLKLSVGDAEIGYTFQFLVLEKSSKTLKLRELTGDGKDVPSSEITFSRKQ